MYNIVKVVGVIVDIGVMTIEITIYILQQFPKKLLSLSQIVECY